MELAVLWVVLIAVGAFVLGLVGGWIAARRDPTAAATASTPLAGAAATPAAETTASEAIPEPDIAGAAAVSPDADADAADDSSAAEVSGHRSAAGDAPGTGLGPRDPTTGPAGADVAAPARLGRDERARYAEIIGIETENASLRAVASRVPGLERRVRELEATIEEHTGHSEPVIDLTGPDPVARPDDADIASR